MEDGDNKLDTGKPADSLTNFDERNHRVESSTAVFQKGLYHVFVLRDTEEVDKYACVLRTYQALFQVCLAHLLLDFDYPLSPLLRGLPHRLRNLCKDPEQPTRRDLDPASLVTHSVFENRRWVGFSTGHPLHDSSKRALALYSAVVTARHNLIYRPFLLNGPFWEDCTLIDLLGTAPSAFAIEEVYRSFADGILQWWAQQGPDPLVARYFIQMLFAPYSDRRDSRPTETLLLGYARMLCSADDQRLARLRSYRNDLFDLENVSRYEGIRLLPQWRVGEL